ncbi:MAG: hypothetical protein KAR06_08125 [Deltaproteobacteria bacterium]|nr:hypothetical protein [Deltaproteobacteria bacterium]
MKVELKEKLMKELEKADFDHHIDLVDRVRRVVDLFAMDFISVGLLEALLDDRSNDFDCALTEAKQIYRGAFIEWWRERDSVVKTQQECEDESFAKS